MSISFLNKPNPNLINFNGKPVTEVYYNGTKVWPDEEDPFEYDLVIPMPASNEIDFLYTSDIHCGWKDFGAARWGESFKTFSLDVDQLTGQPLVGGDVKAYQNKLKSQGIPTYLLDCGDWSMGSGAGYSQSASDHAIDVMEGMDYFGITYGNWEFKWSTLPTAFSKLDRLKNHGLMACNLGNGSNTILYPGGKNPNIPGVKTIKVGNKKIALIGIGYPSPNGTETYDEVEYNGTSARWNVRSGGTTLYRFRDSVNDASAHLNRTAAQPRPGSIYGTIQTDIIDNYLKPNNFDYIICFGHIDKYTDEDYTEDDRFFTRADFLAMNVNDIDAIIPGHLNMPVADTYEYTNKAGKICKVMPEAGGTMNSFGRLRINLNTGAITGNLLTSLDDLR